ncbi:hypothetical protein C8R46DRAFT_1273682 [Mycena filopes]|nr:hypothetical protein C8R46DRAFT_1273682 [Mycena filopes]
MSEAAVNFNATIGPEEVGVIVGAWMFGIFTIQAFNYFAYFPDDSKRLKFSVAGLWILELLHVILSCVGLYSTTVTHFGDGPRVLYINTAIGLSLIISSIVGPGVFFANRVRVLGGGWIIPVFCWFLSFVRMLSLVAVCAATLTTPFIPAFKAKWDWLVLSSIAVSTTVDVVVALSFTQQKIDSLLAWTINTGLLTSAASIMMLIFFVTMANFAWLTMLLVIPRLFANSMLASYENYHSPRAYREEKTSYVEMNPGSFGARSLPNRKHPTSIAIEMSHTRDVVRDRITPNGMDDKTGFESDSQTMGMGI